MTITLTPEIERALTVRASRQGTTPEQMALHDLTELYAETETDKPDPFEGKTLADVLAGHIGTIRSSEYTGIEVSHLSEDEDNFTDYLVEKRHSVMEFYSVGHDAWAGADVQQYINEMRDKWDR